jgi:hypothetical protein
MRCNNVAGATVLVSLPSGRRADGSSWRQRLLESRLELLELARMPGKLDGRCAVRYILSATVLLSLQPYRWPRAVTAGNRLPEAEDARELDVVRCRNVTSLCPAAM